MEYCLMITVQIHSRKKILKGVKMTTAINTGAQQELRYPAARLNESGFLQVWGGDPLKTPPLCA